jgi:predicted amino acid-binding ACT domain protein
MWFTMAWLVNLTKAEICIFQLRKKIKKKKLKLEIKAWGTLTGSD